MKKFWNWKKTKTVDQETGQETEERVLFLNGTIAEESWFDDDVTPALFKDELNAGTGDITLWINSPGGDCIAAAQIYNMLSEYPGKVTVKIDGIAASAASVIAMAGNDVQMSPVSMMMIHNPATIAWGDHTEMKKAMELLDAVKESIINAYVLKTGQSRAKLSHLMDAETWMDANKAVELGFADGILFTRDSQSGEEVEGIAGFSQEKTGTEDSVMFSRRAVNNALVNKLEKHYGKRSQPVKDQAVIPDPSGVNVSKDPCYECFGAAENACRNCEKGRFDHTGQATGQDNGRSADELRERLSFIKKFI